MNPATIGMTVNNIVLGKHSEDTLPGKTCRAGLQLKQEALIKPLSGLRISMTGKEITDRFSLWARSHCPEKFQLEHMHISSGNRRTDSYGRYRFNDQLAEEAAQGRAHRCRL